MEGIKTKEFKISDDELLSNPPPTLEERQNFYNNSWVSIRHSITVAAKDGKKEALFSPLNWSGWRYEIINAIIDQLKNEKDTNGEPMFIVCVSDCTDSKFYFTVSWN